MIRARLVPRLAALLFLPLAWTAEAAAAEVAMAFAPNRGQAAAGAAWLGHAPGAFVAVSADGATIDLLTAGRAVGLTFDEPAAAPTVRGTAPLPGTLNIFRGADPAGWRSGIPTFGGVAVHDLYHGIDMQLEGSATTLKGTFVVAPGAHPSVIRWRYRGVDALRVRTDGALLLDAGAATVVESAPVAWQEEGGERTPVEVGYRRVANDVVGFTVGAYDPSRPLVIDPYLDFATLVGGGEGEEGRGVVVDGSGNSYVTGSTRSSDFPEAGGPQPEYAGPFTPSNLGDAFFFKLAPDGKTVLFMTYLGGSDEEVGDAIALAPDGGIVITGTTESTDFPTVDALQPAQGGQDCSSAPCNDLFIAKLSPDGGALEFSTYLGGSRDESASLIDVGTRLNKMGLATDADGAIYVLGTSDSPDFPVVNGYQDQRAGLNDLVLVKLSGDGDQILYSTYLGGGGGDYSGDLALAGDGHVWVAGGTLSSDFPTRNAFDETHEPPSDAVLARIDTTASGAASLLSSTYLGGSETDQAFGVGVDGDGNVHVAGWTASDDFPVLDAFQATNASSGDPQPRDAFLTVFEGDGRTLVFSSYFGGSDRDIAYDLHVDAEGTSVIGGPTSSDDLPVRLPYQAWRRQGIDLFVARLDPRRSGGDALVFSTYLGGDDSDVLYGVAGDAEGSVFVTGATAGVVSESFPVDTTIGANATTDGVLVAKLLPQVQRWLLVGSRANGANDSIWRTDLGLANGEAEAAEIEVRFHQASGVVADTYVVAPGSQRILEDAVGLIGGSGNGALEIVADRDVTVTSRTYNLIAPGQACYPRGTLGQGLESIATREALLVGESAWLPQLVETASYRSNIALTNTGLAPARVTVRLYDGDGRQLATYSVELAPGQWKQENRPFATQAGATDLAAGYARVTVEEGGGVVAVGSVVDNITNDPTTIQMVAATAAGHEESWVLVGSHADGANNSTWRTDLGILNVSPQDASVEIRVHTPGGVLSTVTDVPDRAQVILEDVLDRIPYTGSGAIELVSTSPIVVSSRTYNRIGANQACSPNGTLGQGFVGHGAGAGLAAGEAATLNQLTENAAYRTNIALTNSGAATAEVSVELFDGDGTEVGSYEVTLAPGEWRQENRPFVTKAGRNDLPVGYARVTVVDGSGVLAAASVVDNITNDPTTIVWSPIGS